MLQSWKNKFPRLIPHVNAVIPMNDHDARAETIVERVATGTVDVLMAFHGACMIEESKMRRFAWQCILVDGAHRIKNDRPLILHVVHGVHSVRRLY